MFVFRKGNRWKAEGNAGRQRVEKRNHLGQAVGTSRRYVRQIVDSCTSRPPKRSSILKKCNVELVVNGLT